MNGSKTMRVFPVLAFLLLLTATGGTVLVFSLLLTGRGGNDSVDCTVHDLVTQAPLSTQMAFFLEKTVEALPTQTPYYIIITATAEETAVPDDGGRATLWDDYEPQWEPIPFIQILIMVYMIAMKGLIHR